MSDHFEFEGYGTVQGEAALLHAGFTYRKPILQSLNIFTLDPERLHPANEYPRSVNPPHDSSPEHVELADYKITVEGMGADRFRRVRVWMLPNEVTAARTPMLVCEFLTGPAVSYLEIMEEARRLAFRR